MSVWHKTWAKKLRAAADRLDPPPPPIPASLTTAQRNAQRWFQDGAELTLRLDYDLTAAAVAVDIGGYEGRWASDLFAKYGCRVLVFEPVPEFARRIARRFAHNPRIEVFPFGLTGRDQTASIQVAADASSVLQPGGLREPVELRDATAVLRDQMGLARIDVMKINIEGGEYELLESLLASGYVRQIENIQVQFHDFVPDAEGRMQRIQEKLAQTHELTYQYLFVWENWRRRPAGTPGAAARSG
jgi:FkbM family methyltransferase